MPYPNKETNAAERGVAPVFVSVHFGGWAPAQADLRDAAARAAAVAAVGAAEPPAAGAERHAGAPVRRPGVSKPRGSVLPQSPGGWITRDRPRRGAVRAHAHPEKQTRHEVPGG